MITSRRHFLEISAITAMMPWLNISAQNEPGLSLIKPPRLKKGDTVSLISPAFAAFKPVNVEIKVESLEAMGLKVKMGKHFYHRYGYLAGTDEERAADVNAAFADPEVKAVISHSGGWGCARLLPFLDYEMIKKNPKVLLGFSDNTSLLLGIHAKTGLITFHGPAPRNKVSAEYTRRLIFDGEAMEMQNPIDFSDNLAPTKHRIQVINPGTASGRILGGNLTVLSAILGSGYLPDWKDCILFLEDVEEQIYSVDRMLTQLKLAGVLEQIKGFIFGTCTRCAPGERYGSLTLEDLFEDHLKPLGVPAFQGMMIGHIKNQFTIPIGVPVKMNAEEGTIQMLESAVQ